MTESRSLTVAERLSAIPAFALTQDEALSTLCASVYPGAKRESALMVLSYCKANVLDPFQKPVHIVPTKVKIGEDEKGKPKYEERDVVMPGIGLYRTQAARTGQYAGVSEPEFGPIQVLEFVDDRWEDGADGRRHKTSVTGKVEYPEWCKVTVRRVVAGHVAEFHAIEYWLENYATKGYGVAPNAMWRKRPRGQLAKCAEAQALRRAFPEFGSAPTAEELEGKTLDIDEIVAPEPAPERQRPQSKTEAAKAPLDIDPETGEIIGHGGGPEQKVDSAPPAKANGSGNGEAKASPPASPGMLNLIRAKAKAQATPLTDDAAICAWFGDASLTTLEGLTVAKGNEILKELQA